MKPDATRRSPKSDGYVKLTNSSAGSTHVIADVAGYFVGGVPTAPGTFVPVTPTRLLDTRSGGVPVGAQGIARLQVIANSAVTTVNVGAVVLNVTEVAPTAPGTITVYPGDEAMPIASNLNFLAGDVRANLVTVKVTNGQIAFKNASAGSVHLIVDVAGYYLRGTATTAGAFVAVSPTRVLDTRAAMGVPTASPVPASGTIPLNPLGSRPPDAAGVAAVILNVTETAPTKPGNITVYPASVSLPTASNLNFGPGDTYPNLVAVSVGATGQLNLRNSSAGSTHVIADLAGYYLKNTWTGLQSGQMLDSGGVIASPSGEWRLVMQPDGNLVLYGPQNVVKWSSGTYNDPGSFVVMQGDGNLVVYRGLPYAVWNSGTAQHPGAILRLQDDGNLVIYDQGQAIWVR